MSRRTLTPAPNPHQAPPVSAATRRDLFGTMGALLLLTAAEAGSAKAAELDGELLSCCRDFYAAHRRYVESDQAPTWYDEEMDAITEDRCGILRHLGGLVARTPEGLRAKAEVLRIAMDYDVRVQIADTFEDRARPHEWLAMSLCRDLLGRAGA